MHRHWNTEDVGLLEDNLPTPYSSWPLLMLDLAGPSLANPLSLLAYQCATTLRPQTH